MANPGFQLLFDNLSSVGFFEFFLPLILFLAIYFGLLRKTEVLGDDEAVVGVASLALAFITVFGTYIFVPATFFTQFFGVLSLALVSILSIVLMAGLVGYEFGPEGDRWLKLGSIGIGIIIVLLAAPTLFANLFDLDGVQVTVGEDLYSFLLTLALVGIMGFTVWQLTEASD